jgi:hypothetical protein
MARVRWPCDLPEEEGEADEKQPTEHQPQTFTLLTS